MAVQATIGSGWALVQKSTILHYGLDANQMYQDEGLDVSHIQDPDYRFPAVPFNRIWHKIESETHSHDVGLVAANFVLPTTFHALGMAMWSSRNLADALARLMRYSSIFHNGGGASVQKIENHHALVISRKQDGEGITLVTDIGIDCLFAALFKLFKQLSLNSFQAKKVLLTRRAPPCAEQYRELFDCPVEFEASHDAILMENDSYYSAFPGGNDELAGMSDNAASEYLARFDQEDIVARVRQLLTKKLSSGEITQDYVAKELAMSVRTLQRALKQQNTGFQQVLDDTRKELAKYYIIKKHLSLGEIGFLLGFSVANNFSRSFKRWYNMSPARYREARLAKVVG